MSKKRLSKKLSRLTSAGAGGARRVTSSPSGDEVRDPPASLEDPQEARMRSLRERMIQLRRGRKNQKRVARKNAPQDVPGVGRETVHGVVQVVETTHEAAHRHGEVAVGGALRVCGSVVSRLALDEQLADFDPRRALFLDTETTGLAGGSGTVPFLVGVGFFEGESFRVEQLLLRELGAEKPLLRWLGERIAASSSVVSFNGKSYDWPLLRTRFVMNRLPPPTLPPHLDLLHSARRVFRHQLSEMRLTTLEREVLGYHRQGDIPGAEIPKRYFDYLESGEGGLLEDIVRHNADDVVAMAALLGVLQGVMEAPEAGADPRVKLAVAQLQVRAHEPAQALEFVEAICASEAETPWKWEALLLGATVLRREKRWDACEGVLLRALELAGVAAGERSRAHLMLAKLYEHQKKDFQGALEHASLAEGAEEAAGVLKRLKRLEGRLESAASAK
ncbi:MAG: ribonuclease H-like domain-containing protein [Myxococcota bacterium]|nr:ribonuclease H-like domain-containing protein [Myxococcota bacterium]